MSRSPDSLRAVFLRHRPRLLLTLLLLWTTMLAGTALLGLSGGFLTAAALAGAAVRDAYDCAPLCLVRKAVCGRSGS